MGKRVRETAEKRASVLGKVNTTIPSLREARKVFDELTVLLPEREFALRRDPGSIPLMERYDKGVDGAGKELGEYIDKNWVTNPTLIDLEYVKRTRPEDDENLKTDEDKLPAIEADSFELAKSVISGLPFAKEVSSILVQLGQWFDLLSLSMTMLSKRMKVEVLHADMLDVMERIRYNCLQDRSKPAGLIDPAGFSRKYDRIHMSNIP